MRKLLLLCLLVTLSSGMMAQAVDFPPPSSIQWQLKVHAASRFQWKLPSDQIAGRSMVLDLPFVTLTRQKIRGDFHEISLGNLSIRARSTLGVDSLQLDQRQRSVGTQLTYRYGGRVHAWGNLYLYLAYLTRVEARRRSAETVQNGTIQTRGASFSLELGVEPILQFALNDRFRLECSVPLGLISGSLMRQRSRTVAPGLDWQDTYAVAYHLPRFQAISTRLGVVITL